MEKESKLSITTSADRMRSSVEILGTPKQHISNLALLVRDVGKVLNIPPFVMASILVKAIDQYERTENGSEIIMDLDAMRRERGAT
ncbi:MAG: hypothetical protein K2O18_14390 [Oscillospiraceae bacterium]|nr:hypothetical protein [Oscillospiraceae bacterium]